ncbi:DUF2470 domain-containing protein [Nocardiopsis sp. N85]|uniref:DUF2470 domain-containing protein n=1 Tax=Nocardiopsis sp. N85 TaxID=3029400 RepID=UPI00237F30A0|nr:DUF2470 domain-containing protein [Nocardiopsis sp. N85]MDE3723688.1 DUF2470 domain-containing protein [Nocardiopsis sp. N85]
MVPLHTSRHLAPSPAERARAVLSRPNPATVTTQGGTLHLVDPACHVHPGGTVSLLLPDRHHLLDEMARGRTAATVEFTDTGAVALRDPTRSLLWISGTLTALDEATARMRALRLIRDDPDERLLDIGHGRTMVVLEPYLVVHSDTEGCHLLGTDEFVRALPDPLGRWEGPWLRHLEEDHPDLLMALAGACPAPVPLSRPRPLGVDRYGMTLRFEAPDGDHDVRLSFSRPVESPEEVAVEVHALAGLTDACGPF